MRMNTTIIKRKRTKPGFSITVILATPGMVWFKYWFNFFY